MARLPVLQWVSTRRRPLVARPEAWAAASMASAPNCPIARLAATSSRSMSSQAATTAAVTLAAVGTDIGEAVLAMIAARVHGGEEADCLLATILYYRRHATHGS